MILALSALSGCEALRVDVGAAPAETTFHFDPAAMEVVATVGEPQVVQARLVHDDGPAVELDTTITGPGHAAWAVDAPDTLEPGDAVPLVLTLNARTWGDHSATVIVTAGDTEARLSLSAWATADGDGDGHGSLASGGDDCDDTNPATFPGAPDTWYDGVDSDCAGNDDMDADGDGFEVDEDCDDADAAVGENSPETWNGLDDDCDGAVDDLPAGTFSPWVEGDAADLGLGAADATFAATTEEGLVIWAISADGGDAYALQGAPVSTDLLENPLSRINASYGVPMVWLSRDRGDTDGDGAAELLVTTARSASTDTAVWLVDVRPPADDVELASILKAGFVASEIEEEAWCGVLEDLDGDGLDDVVIGAPLEDDYWDVGDDEHDGDPVGAVAVWMGPVDGYHSFADADEYVHGADVGHYLGYRVTAGDLDDDGYGDLLVGEPGNDDAESDGGALQVIHGSKSLNWKAGIDQTAESTLLGDSYAAALGDTTLPAPVDLDLDGQKDVVVAAPGAGVVAAIDGSALASGTSTLGSLARTWSGAGAAGTSVCVADIDGVPSVFVGAPEVDLGAGEVWRLSVAGGGFAVAGPIAGGGGAALGSGCVDGADVDGDGVPDVLLGGASWDRRASNGGLLMVVPSW